jgi:hypothetical protein
MPSLSAAGIGGILEKRKDSMIHDKQKELTFDAGSTVMTVPT